MSDTGDDFRPRLGRVGDGGKRSSMSAIAHVRAARRGGGGRSASGGAARYAGSGRRVMVKARVVRIAGKGLALQRAHLSYLSRDGAGKERERGEFYDREQEGVEGQGFLERGRADRHHFRFIVSPEDGQQIGDLKPFVRELMGQMEADLDTRLDWIAMDHHDTGHPHTHIVVRGVRLDGSELRMERDYISRGIRQRAGAILTRELGLETVDELDAKLDSLTEAPRVTRMDQLLARRAGDEGRVDLGDIKRHQHQYQARLRYLERQGLAKEVGGGRWRVSAGLIRALGAMERQDIALERTRAALRAAGIERAIDRPFVAGQSHELTGRVIGSGLDEHTGKTWLIVDGTDGRAHHVGLNGPSGMPLGEIVHVSAARIERFDGRSLEAQVRAPGLTWLDRHLAGKDSAEIMAAGFGAEVREAGRQRLAELEQRGLIGGMDQPLRPDAATLETLRWAGIHHEGRAYAGESGRAYRPVAPGRTLEGTLETAIDTPSGRLAVISTGHSREFSLVPWQDEMKRHLHQGIPMDVSRSMSLSRLRQRSLGIGM
jgi:type IV secretory pathway VirD2 relaxase